MKLACPAPADEAPRRQTPHRLRCDRRRTDEELEVELQGDHAISIRHVRPADREAWVQLRQALWPEGSESEHSAEADRFFRGASTEPLAVLVAEDPETGLIGFVEVSIRSYAEGCVTSRVGYLEGWFVAPGARRRGTGRALVRAAERWARSQRCPEFASDTEAGNRQSALAHRALGFAEVGVVRCFRKDLAAQDEAAGPGVRGGPAVAGD